MNKDILLKIDEIINCIEQMPNYQKYLLIKEKMVNDSKINNLLEEIRILQKRLAHNPNNIEIKKELNLKNRILKDIPLYREYLNTLDDINNIFNIIENNLNKYFYSKVN